MTKLEYLKLRETIEYHMDRYYNQDDPEISDYEYDMLMKQLKDTEKEHPDWIDNNSPSQKVGGKTKREAGVKVTHDVAMLSIEDVFDTQSVVDWMNKVKTVHPNCVFSVETKIDGLSLTLRYEKDESGVLRLNLAETRGDGFIGEDVTINAMVIPDIKKTLDLPYDKLQLRGEVYMTRENFNRYNKQMEELGKELSKNARNLAAGTLRQLDSTITKERGLNMFVFNIQLGDDELMQSHTAGLKILDDAGVPTSWRKTCTTPEEALEIIDEIAAMRATLPYDIDGAVIKIDNIAYRDDFPTSAKYSSGHIAYKYPPEKKVVVMDDIDVKVGRTGKLSFTGIFHDKITGKLAILCGTEVSRATLHNQNYINNMSIGIGGEYWLFKSGEIIPKLDGCVTKPKMVFKAPCNCPVCGSTLVKDDGVADIFCVNPSCSVQLSRTIANFASKDCMNIIGLGETIIEDLVVNGYLTNYADIYTLKDHKDELVASGIIGKEKNTTKILAAIEKSKENDPDRLLTGLGIRNIGKVSAASLMKEYKNIWNLAKASVDELEQIENVGSITANDIVIFFKNQDNIKILKKLEDCGVIFEMSKKDVGNVPFANMTFVVTGTLPNMGRSEAEQFIIKNGGKVSGSVSKNTTYVVAGEKAGGKLTKAQSLGVPVISEEEMIRLSNE